MDRRNGQVDDDVDVLGIEKVGDALGAHAIFLGPGFRRCMVDVGAGPDLDALEERRELEIGG